MAHPFTRMFTVALGKSTEDENLVLREAERLREKGYRVSEINDVLTKFSKGIIDAREAAIASEALEEFSRHLDD